MGQRSTKPSQSDDVPTPPASSYQSSMLHRHETLATKAEASQDHPPPPPRSQPNYATSSHVNSPSSSRSILPALPPKVGPPYTRQSSNSSNKLASLEKFYLKYKDDGEDAILAQGMETFCSDLGVEPTDFIVLLIAWRFQASEMCRFTREEFMNGCQRLRAHDSRSLKQRFPDLMEETKMEKNFKDLYQFTFSFGLDRSAGQRSLPIDMAIPLWELVHSQHRPAILDSWFAYLHESGIRFISRDTWNMFLPFVKTIKPDFSNYDDSEAWPSLFDDFVEREREKQH